MRTCPFCGYDEGWVNEQPDGKLKVVCKVCGSSGPESNTHEGAEKKWDGILAQIENPTKFEEALQEEMGGAAAPAVNLVNTPGMGTAEPGSTAAMTGGQQYDDSAIGSGDKWAAEKKKKKKKKKKITEHKIFTIEEYASKLK